MDRYKKITEFIRSLYPGKDVIALHEPVFTGREREYVLDCIDTTFVSSVGKYVDRYEEMVRAYTGAGCAVATVNGTAALHIALLLAGVRPGDLVITQPLTFVATCNTITYGGAEPVFLDINSRTLGLAAAALEDWLGENAGGGGKDCVHKQSGRRIAACVPMHTFGLPCEIDRIAEICGRYGIPLVEDAAESIGSLYKGKSTGTFGLLGTLSFNGNKTITTGGGGMILTGDAELGSRAKHLTTQAKVPHPWSISHDMIGYNYRLPNLNAALGCAQLEKLDIYISYKRATAAKYEQFFAGLGLRFITEPEGSRSNYWLCSVMMESGEDKDAFLKYSHERKIMTRPCWTLMPKLPMFSGVIRTELPVAEETAARLVNIPSGVYIS